MIDPRRAARGALHATLLLMMAGLGACTPLDDAMVAIFGRGMRDQPSFDPYENTRPVPDNSVPFAAANFPAGPGEVMLGDPDMAGPMPPPMEPSDLLQRTPVVMELENPVEPTEESLARGEELYTRYCAVCHGDSGIGAEAYIADVHGVLAAYDLSGEAVQELPDGYIYGMIRVGRGLMPGYGHAVSHFDRWNIVNYVRQLGPQDGAEQTDGAGDE